ncbi:hypothetical protein TrVGV298_007052 [Trichoderma virens]|nr:hypothetical protein TrVGV298_007052 [Trichoderma virens]UKZ72422.1 hypothetical protein TrVFT333_000051 [Trichoderma virens FT-333]
MATLTSDLGPASISCNVIALSPYRRLSNCYLFTDFGFRVNYALGNKWDCCLHWERRRDS